MNRILLTLCVAVTLATSANGQTRAVPWKADGTTVQDVSLGIGFQPVGAVVKLDESSYRITISSTDAAGARTAEASIASSPRPFVDLPGSYGGRYFLDGVPEPALSGGMRYADSLQIDGRSFRREYWAVYAGMGMWDEVINCVTQEGGRYVIVSLLQSGTAGKPGMEINGREVKTDEIARKIVDTLRDPSSPIVSRFNVLLHSVTVYRRAEEVK